MLFKLIRFTSIVACVFLLGCTDFDQERIIAVKNLHTFIGQPLQALISKLGPPDIRKQGTKGRLYVWVTSRDLTEEVYAEGTQTVGGKTVIYNPDDHALTKHESCKIIALTDFDDIIVKDYFKAHGKGACMDYFNKIRGSDPKAGYPLFP
jgi:hypothetical protein